MCWMCDHPRATRREYLEHLRDLVATYGWAVQSLARALRPGRRFPLIGGPMIEVVELSDPTARLVNAVEIYGTGIRALQLVHVDDRGHWPWEVGYRGRQPVLGTRAAPSASAA